MEVVFGDQDAAFKEVPSVFADKRADTKPMFGGFVERGGEFRLSMRRARGPSGTGGRDNNAIS